MHRISQYYPRFTRDSNDLDGGKFTIFIMSLKYFSYSFICMSLRIHHSCMNALSLACCLTCRSLCKAFSFDSTPSSVVNVIQKSLSCSHQIAVWPFISSVVLCHYQIHVRMKIFETIQRHFAILGITVNQTRNLSSISLKNVLILFGMLFSVVSQIICIISVAETFEEYTLCIYGSFTLAVTCIELAMHIWKMKQLFEFIENFEHIIETSE